MSWRYDEPVRTTVSVLIVSKVSVRVCVFDRRRWSAHVTERITTLQWHVSMHCRQRSSAICQPTHASYRRVSVCHFSPRLSLPSLFACCWLGACDNPADRDMDRRPKKINLGRNHSFIINWEVFKQFIFTSSAPTSSPNNPLHA